MYKRIFSGFVLLLSILILNPVTTIQFEQELLDINFLATTISTPYQYYRTVENTKIDTQQTIALAEQAGVSLFCRISDSNYFHLQDQRYLEEMPFVQYNSVDEFNNSKAVYSTSSTTHPIDIISENRVVSLTSLNNMQDDISSFTVTGNEQAIENFLSLMQSNFSNVEFLRVPQSEAIITRKAPMLEFIDSFGRYLVGAEIGVYSLFILILLCIILQISSDSRRIIIKKVHGYSSGHIIAQYLRDFLAPIFVIGTGVFVVGFFVLGNNFSSFWITLLKHEMLLVLFAVGVTILFALTSFFVGIMQPIDILKGKKTKAVTVSFMAVIKVLLIFLIIPALSAHIIQSREFWEVYRYRQDERHFFQNYHVVQTLIPMRDGFDWPEFYRRMEDSSILFSRQIGLHGTALDDEYLIMTNSEMVNQSKLLAGGDYVHLPKDEPFLIVSHDLDVERIKNSQIYQNNFICSGNLTQQSCDQVEIIQLDPDQEFLTKNHGRESPMLDSFMLTVNTYVPSSHSTDYYYKDLDERQISEIEEQLNAEYEGRFALLNYVEAMPTSGNTLRFVKENISMFVLIFSVLLTNLLFYLSITDFYMKKLAVTYIHGTGLHRSLAPLLGLSLAANIFLGTLSLLVGQDLLRKTTAEQLSIEHFIIALAILCVLDIGLWLLSVYRFKNKPVKVLSSK